MTATTHREASETQSNSTDTVKISLRINPGYPVTSLTIKKNIVSLWTLLRTDGDSNDSDDNPIRLISAFVYNSLALWKKETGQGLSDFITELLIKDMLSWEEESEEDQDDLYQRYLKIKETL